MIQGKEKHKKQDFKASTNRKYIYIFDLIDVGK